MQAGQLSGTKMEKTEIKEKSRTFRTELRRRIATNILPRHTISIFHPLKMSSKSNKHQQSNGTQQKPSSSLAHSSGKADITDDLIDSSMDYEDEALLKNLIKYSKFLHDQGQLSDRYFNMAQDLISDRQKLPAWRELVYTFAISDGPCSSANNTTSSSSDDSTNLNSAECEQYLQALRSGIVAEARARWSALGLLDRFPVDVAKEISSMERDQRNEFEAKHHPPASAKEPNTHSNDSLVYGEVDVGSFAEIFAHYLPNLPKRGGVFVDLGSGTGRAVFGAWLLHDFDQCLGVELLKSLYDISVKELQGYQSSHEKYIAQVKRAEKEASKNKVGDKRKLIIIPPKSGSLYSSASASSSSTSAASSLENSKKSSNGKSDSKGPVSSCHTYSFLSHSAASLLDTPATRFQPFALDPSRIEFTLGDLRQFDWTAADCVFCAATCFDGPLLQHIADTAARLKSGAYLISLSEALKGPHLKLVHSMVYRMSWGRATVHIHERI
jgi:hypothetical protein